MSDMGALRSSEVAAAGIRFPVVVLTPQKGDDPRVRSRSGETSSPDSLTVEYPNRGVTITSYPEPLWGDEPHHGFPDLASTVEHGYGNVWNSREGEPPNFQGLEAEETTFTKTEKGYIECSSLDRLPGRWKASRDRAVSEAHHRVVVLDVGGSQVESVVVGRADLWAAGFGAEWEGKSLAALLDGGSVPVESLSFEFTVDLFSRIGSAYADA